MIYQVRPLQTKKMMTFLGLVLTTQPIDQHLRVDYQMYLLQQVYIMIDTDQFIKWLPWMVVYLIY